MKSLEDYLKLKEENFAKLRSEIALLRSVKVPIKIKEYGSGDVAFFSEDYSLATNFKIERRSENLGGTSGYDGGYTTDRYESYPQFYFTLKRSKLSKGVYIQHPGFDKDKRIIIKSETITRGWKDYTGENSRNEESIDVQKVFDFFKDLGVKPYLLDKLARRIKEAGEF